MRVNAFVTVAYLTASPAVQEFAHRHHAKVKLSQQNSGGVLFSLVGPDERLLTPMYSTSLGLVEYLRALAAEPLMDIREVL